MKFKAMTAVAALLFAPAAFAGGADDDTLIVNGDIEMTTKAPAPAHLDGALDEIISGWHFRSDETQQLQTDDFENQGMIFVDQAMDIWDTAEGSEGKACSDCHADPADSMAGVAATYPKWNEDAGELRTVQMQVNDCRVNRMGADAWKYDATDAVSMEAMIASHSRGMPVDVAIDGPVAEAWEKGKEIYYTRYGQLELACASCQLHPCRPPQPGPDQRFPDLPSEECQAERRPQPFQGLHPRYARGNLQPGVGRVHCA